MSKQQTKNKKKPIKRVALVSPVKIEIDWTNSNLVYSGYKGGQSTDENQKGD